MCSFAGTNLVIKDFEKINKFIKNRGPDKTSVYTNGELTLVHNLLSITGEFKEQPLVSEDEKVLCVYNGEIYNYKTFGDYRTDGECIIPLYKEHGTKFASHLDGEFAIVIIDLAEDKIIFVTDPFATKPLWCSVNGSRFAFATYESSVLSMGFNKATKISANTIISLRLSTMETLNKETVYKFDTRQHKNNYDDWYSAFIESLSKRTSGVRENVFIGLSGGYDSGAIACGLNVISSPYKAYTIIGNENENVINERKKLISNMDILDITPEEFYYEKDFLNKECEDFKWQGKPAARTDKASAGLSHICRIARNEDFKIYLSGQGADEIISDYGRNGTRIFNHSQFGGRFPELLEPVFPWRNFYKGTQEKYLGKEECVAGSHGVETRYPFLDANLVQEFLWLSHTLKNQKYKAPIDYFLKKNNFPFTTNEKVGFRPNHKFRS